MRVALSRVTFDAECPEHINIGNTSVARPGARAREHHAERSQAHRLAMMLAPAKVGTPSEPAILTLVRPRRRLTPVPTAEQSSHRAQRQCKDGAQRHPKGSSLTGASTMAASGGSGPDGATHTSLPRGKPHRTGTA
jgi:hypothetical protein